MKMQKETFGSRGVTRLELMTVVGVIALVGLVALPGVANTRTRSARLGCVSNLRQIGVAFQAWGNDHLDSVPARTPVGDGGLMDHPGASNAWLQFAWLSNELATPRLLACPDDEAKTPVSTWNDLRTLANPNGAVSYFVGPDALPHLPHSAVSGDRGLQPDGVGNCSARIVGLPSFIVTPPKLRGGWTNRQVHALEGNLLLKDGRVIETTTASLRWSLVEGNVDINGVFHVILP